MSISGALPNGLADFLECCICEYNIALYRMPLQIL
jgi:hypothetical protein